MEEELRFVIQHTQIVENCNPLLQDTTEQFQYTSVNNFSNHNTFLLHFTRLGVRTALVLLLPQLKKESCILKGNQYPVVFL